MKRHSLIFTAPQHIEIQSEACPSPAEGEVLVKTLASAISPGTEMLIYRGQAPTNLTADATIKALAGGLAYPLKYGYACVGRVLACGPDVDPTTWEGRLVFAFNPHETHFSAPLDAVHPLPDGTSVEQALFLPNMETALTFVHDGQPLVGERVIVFGQGVVGLLTLSLLAHTPLESLTTVDHFTLRRQHAQQRGATHTYTPAEVPPSDADLTYEVSGAPAALDAAIKVTGYAGRVVIGSWYGTKPVTLNMGGAFHRSRIQLISSQVSTIEPALRGRWTKQRRIETTWRLLQRTQPTNLITHRIPFTTAAEAYKLLEQHPEEAVQVILTYET